MLARLVIVIASCMMTNEFNMVVFLSILNCLDRLEFTSPKKRLLCKVTYAGRETCFIMITEHGKVNLCI